MYNVSLFNHGREQVKESYTTEGRASAISTAAENGAHRKSCPGHSPGLKVPLLVSRLVIFFPKSSLFSKLCATQCPAGWAYACNNKMTRDNFCQPQFFLCISRSGSKFTLHSCWHLNLSQYLYTHKQQAQWDQATQLYQPPPLHMEMTKERCKISKWLEAPVGRGREKCWLQFKYQVKKHTSTVPHWETATDTLTKYPQNCSICFAV